MEPASYAPGGGNTACIWSPLHTYSNSNAVNNVGYSDGITLANAILQQGFTNVVWNSDETGDTDLDVGDCTSENYLDMRNGGVVCVTASHGEPGYHHAVFAPYFPEGRAVIENWCSNSAGMECRYIPPDTNNPALKPGYYYARVSSAWHQSNWKPGLDTNRAITVWSVCHSATASGWQASLKEAAGGRWRIGYIGVTMGIIYSVVNETFFGYMNGSLGDELRRTAGAAFNAGSEYHSSVRMSGNPWTTLCPAPTVRNAFMPADNFPAPGTSASSGLGWGCVVFDTYVDGGQQASQALPGNNVHGTHWFQLGAGKRGIGFFYDKSAEDLIWVTINGANCKSEGVGGGRSADMNRVAPNGDTTFWIF